MSLPIDRTAKSTLDTNLINGNTSDAPAIKANNDVAYNTIDELNNKVDSLVASGTLLPSIKPNILFNPSANMNFAGWTVTGSFGASISPVFGTTGEGSYFLMTSASATTGLTTVDSAKIPANPNYIFNLQAELNTFGQTAGAKPTLQLDAYNTTNNYISTLVTLTPSVIGQSWTKYKGSGFAPVNTSYLRVRMVYPTGVISTFSGFRRMKVEEGNTSSVYSDDNTMNTIQYKDVLPLAQVLSGGNKQQSGTGSIVIATAGTNVGLSVTFPVAFSAVPTSVLITYQGGLAGSAGYVVVGSDSSGWTTTGFTVFANAYLAGTLKFGWIAIGN